MWESPKNNHYHQCNSMQHNATLCNTSPATWYLSLSLAAAVSNPGNKHTVTHCNLLSHIASHYETLQRTATRSLQPIFISASGCCCVKCTHRWCIAIKVKHAATCCNTLQHTVAHFHRAAFASTSGCCCLKCTYLSFFLNHW